MRTAASTKFAIRGLGRNLRRTILSAVGVGIAVAICLVITAAMYGGWDIWLDGMVESGYGHLRIAPEGWLERRQNEMRLEQWRTELATARSMEGVETATPRARSNALLGFGTRIVGVELVGVDPSTEPETCRYVRHVSAGRYLLPDDEGVAVVGAAIADRLDVALDDELLVTAVGEEGEMRSAMLVMVGIVETGSEDIDATICQVTLQDLGRITGIPGAGEIIIKARGWDDARRLASGLKGRIGRGNAVIGTTEVLAGFFTWGNAKTGYTYLIVGIAVFVTVLGIVSAQLTAVLERRREFAVLTALGMKGSQMARLLLVEALALGLAGAVLGLILAAPTAYYLATEGFDITNIYEELPAVAGILVDPVIYGTMGLWMVPMAFGLALAATFLASVYPIWLLRKIDPASALRVAQ